MVARVCSVQLLAVLALIPWSAVSAQGTTPEKSAPKTVVVSEEAKRVHRAGFVFDGHNDLPWAMRSKAESSFERADISKPQPQFHTDIPRLRESNVGAQFWSVFVPMEFAAKGLAFQMTLEQISLVKQMVARYPETFELATSADEVVRIQGAGKIASLMGVEGGHCIEDSIENLRRLYREGARYMTLSHTDTLGWVDAATDDPRHGGLTAFGEEVIREMNRLGMLVDLSHVSEETMLDALRVTQAPIIFSHSSARAVADHPRNVTDQVLRLTAKNGGVVMVNFFSGFVEPTSANNRKNMMQAIRDLKKQYPDAAEYDRARQKWEAEHPLVAGSAADVVDHIDHIVKVAGIDHVGLGADYDGVSLLPRQLEDITGYLVITQLLLDRGYKPAQIHQIMSGNVLRVMKGAEQVARQLRKS